MPKINWLGRETVRAPHTVLCLTEKEYLAVAKECKLESPDRWIDDDCLGVVHHWRVPGKAPICVVCLHPDSAKADPLDVISTLIHESVHVYQRMRRYICEDQPSDEFEAYSIEAIADRLIREYARRTAKPTRKRARG